MIWVIDASVAVRWFLENENHGNADAVLQRMVERPGEFAVPELFSFEVYAVLCRMHPSGHDVFMRGMIPLLCSGIFRQPMTERLARGAEKFINMGLTGYDACYAALAGELDGKWLTFDEKAHIRLKNERISHLLARSMPDKWALP